MPCHFGIGMLSLECTLNNSLTAVWWESMSKVHQTIFYAKAFHTQDVQLLVEHTALVDTWYGQDVIHTILYYIASIPHPVH